jgi:hypothetical protein
MSNQSDDEALTLVTEKFDQITRHVLEGFHRQLELARAENDHEAIVKQQIKIEVLKAARGMYAGCYRIVTKSTPWLEEARS